MKYEGSKTKNGLEPPKPSERESSSACRPLEANNKNHQRVSTNLFLYHQDKRGVHHLGVRATLPQNSESSRDKTKRHSTRIRSMNPSVANEFDTRHPTTLQKRQRIITEIKSGFTGSIKI